MYNQLRFVWNHPLNAHGRLAALRRVLGWQIASRLVRGPIGLPFVQDTWLFATRGMAGATGNYYCGLHELGEMAFVLHLLREDDQFIDIGANIGSYTVLAAGAARARVISVEPIPATFSHLKRNVILNGLSEQAACHQVGLSDAAGTLRFSADLDTVNHVVTQHERIPAIEVPVIKLDDLSGVDSPALLKVDVEGHELAVLNGAHANLAKQSLLAVVMETNGSGERYGISDESLRSLMRQHGFAPFSYDPFRRALLPASVVHGNTVFVRDRPAVESRLRSAPRFTLVNGNI